MVCNDCTGWPVTHLFRTRLYTRIGNIFSRIQSAYFEDRICSGTPFKEDCKVYFYTYSENRAKSGQNSEKSVPKAKKALHNRIKKVYYKNEE